MLLVLLALLLFLGLVFCSDVPVLDPSVRKCPFLQTHLVLRYLMCGSTTVWILPDLEISDVWIHYCVEST